MKKSDESRESDLDALLPYGFPRRTKGSGPVVTSWALQCEVVEHDVVCFLTHHGWNSVLESVMAGVRMLA